MMKTSRPDANFARLLQEFFLERLINQRNASPQTVAAYRDGFRLLLQFAQRHLGKAPECLALTDLDAPVVLAFLNHLENERHNTIRSRNARFAAIRSFLHFAAFKEPTALPVIQRVLAIPMKRFDKPLLGFLSHTEMQAILDAPDGRTWCGQRDRLMFATLYNTGGRVSEITGLCVADVALVGSASVHLHGKGRKNRSVPLWQTTATQIRRWLPRIDSRPDRPLFPSISGTRLTRPAVTSRLHLAVQHAAAGCPSLTKRRVSPHTIRHATAMRMLQAGVDITVIALWLGHENPATTHMYVEADLAMKERALKAVQPPHLTQTRYRPTDRVLQFLQTL
jgi:integrase/recombinase XerD